MYDSWELLMVAQRNRECWPQLQDAWISMATLCQGWSHLRLPALPAWHKEYMSCTAVSPEDTRGQEALT